MLDFNLPEVPPKKAVISTEKAFHRVENSKYREAPTQVSLGDLVRFPQIYDDHITSLRLLGGSLARPDSVHEYVENYEVKGMQKGIKVNVCSGELFSQADVTIWLNLLEYLNFSNYN